MAHEHAVDEKKAKVRKPDSNRADAAKKPADGLTTGAAQLMRLQRQVGNQTVQRMLAQRRGDGSFDLDEETAGRINQARGGGQILDGSLQTQMGEAMGYDFSGVSVHTSPEADTLNQQLGAKAFTTGQDIFFRQGAYDPTSSSGKELVAHELTHVVQQGTGAVKGGAGGMTVTAPNDAYEQEADAAAQSAVRHSEQAAGQAASAQAASVQREAAPEDEEAVQMKALQRETAPEEDEEAVQTKALQRETAPEEDEEAVQTKALQRETAPEDEEAVQMKALQRETAPEEDEEAVQTKALQREALPEEEAA